MRTLLNPTLLLVLGALSVGKAWAQPVITTQPASETVILGETATFSVAATSSGSITYQWQFNGTAIGLATSSNLILGNVNASQAGSYSVVVTDGSGSATSSSATLTVSDLPTYSVFTFGSLSSWAGQNGVLGPNGIAVDPAGNVYVTIGNAVAQVTSGGGVTVIAGNPGAAGASSDGTGGAARFNKPAGIATDGSGNIYVADSGNNAIRKITASGVVTTLAGLVQGDADGVGVAAQFNDPTGVAADKSGNVYVADTGNGALRKVTPDGTTTTLIAASSAGLFVPKTFPPANNYPLYFGPIYYINGVAVDGAGIPYITVSVYASFGYHTYDAIPIYESSLVRVSGVGQFNQQFQPQGPGPLMVDGSGNLYLFLSGDFYEQKATAVNVGGVGLQVPVPSFAAEEGVTAIASDSVGRIYLANAETQSVLLMLPGGSPPSIDSQPSGATIPFGGSVTLTVVASGSPAPTYQWQVDGVNIAGATSPTYVASVPGAYTVVVTNNAGKVTSSPAIVAAATRLVNISSRASVGTGANVEISGFVVTGPPGTTEQVLIRAAGPALSQFGVSGVLAQPVLTLFDSSGNQLASNTGWNNASNAAAIATAEKTAGAFQFPLDSPDSALLVSLAPGAYTAEIAGLDGSTGVALAEVYEMNGGDPELINISTRGFIGQGSAVEIGGFAVTGSQPAKVLVRAIGPALSQFGVSGALAQPSLSVVDSSGNTVAINKGWSTNSNAAAIASEMAAVGAFALPSGSADCALLLTLAPGSYTAVVTGEGGTSGVALVEVYQAP